MIGRNISAKLFLNTLEKVEFGSIAITMPDGKSYAFEGKQDGPKAEITLHDWDVLTAFMFRGDIGVAETYRDEKWDSTDIEKLMLFGLLNAEALENFVYGSEIAQMVARIGYFFKRNSEKGSKKNIAAHYDLGNDFYSLWLDKSMTYSSAFFNGENDLTEAQYNKYDRILERLGASGELLEIGCGWGGLAERAIGKYGHSVKGLTLSEEQHKYAEKRLKEYNGNANIVLQDYRKESQKFDNIVSIEMFEAVGEKYWDTYFAKISACLKQKGKAQIQTITIADENFDDYRKSGDMIRSLIFPGGMLPSVQKFKYHAQKAGLIITDQFAFGKDYAETLRRWKQTFSMHEDKLDEMGYDLKFRRLWKLYLAACAAGFEAGRTDVVQMELQHAS